jgi:DNA-binding transcriptional LysR family regulator
MRNVPTDLLRAFVTIVDLRGYTRAGERLGRSQPAMSLQMKRLQDLIGIPLFDKESGDATLTEAGDVVAGYARRILALNDELLIKLTRRDLRGKLRIGLPNDYADHFLPKLMEQFSHAHSELNLDVVCGVSVDLLRGLRSGIYDIVIAMTAEGPAEDAYLTWREPLIWVGNAVAPNFGVAEPVRLVCYPEGCLYRRQLLSALQREGRPFDIVYTSPSLGGIAAAVSSGFGVTVLAERIVPAKLQCLGIEQRLPALSDVVVGIYINSAADSAPVESLAARFAELVPAPVRQSA